MNESVVPISQRESYTPGALTKFLWWLSTAEKELLVESITDRNRFKITGTTVLSTWIFATLAWTYFFSTIINSIIVFVALGLFMGFVILTIDRALIKGISRNNKHKIIPLLLRAVLALTIGVFMAQPALLFMFNKEIRLQTLMDNEKRKKEKSDALSVLYKVKRDNLVNEKKIWKDELDKKSEDVNKARTAYIMEADGSGGTGKIGIKTIALAKKAEYEKLETEYKNAREQYLPKIAEDDKQLSTINQNTSNEEKQFSDNFNDGFLTRIEALNNLIKNNNALAFRYYLLVTILMLIELMPVLAKTLLPSGVYDEKVRLREEMENEVLRMNIKNETELKYYYSNSAKEFDKDTIEIFFATIKNEKNKKIQSYGEAWSGSNEQSFDSLWSKIKKDMITKNEN